MISAVLAVAEKVQPKLIVHGMLSEPGHCGTQCTNTVDQRSRILRDIIEDTAPKSRINRVRELALMLSLARDQTMLPLALAAFATAGSNGT